MIYMVAVYVDEVGLICYECDDQIPILKKTDDEHDENNLIENRLREYITAIAM